MQIQSSYIFLNNIVFFAYHGVAPQEQIVGNEFYVTIRLKVNIQIAALTDEVSNTVSYANVFESIKSEMDIPSKLLENIAARIIKRLFKDYNQIETIELKLGKRNPPMGAEVDMAGIEMTCNRN